MSLQVDELLPKGQGSIPQLSAALATISRAMDTEMSSMPSHEVRWLESSSIINLGVGLSALNPVMPAYAISCMLLGLQVTTAVT